MTVGELKQVVNKLEKDGVPNDVKLHIGNAPISNHKVVVDEHTMQENIMEQAAKTGIVTFSDGSTAYDANVCDLKGKPMYNNAANEMCMSDSMKSLGQNARELNRHIAGLMGDFAEAATYELLEHVTQIAMNAATASKIEATQYATEMCRIVKKG